MKIEIKMPMRPITPGHVKNIMTVALLPKIRSNY
jgi:hypothetical protein